MMVFKETPKVKIERFKTLGLEEETLEYFGFPPLGPLLVQTSLIKKSQLLQNDLHGI